MESIEPSLQNVQTIFEQMNPHTQRHTHTNISRRQASQTERKDNKIHLRDYLTFSHALRLDGRSVGYLYIWV